ENSGSAGYHKATDYLAGTYFMKLENRSFGYNSLSAGYSEKDYGAFDFYTPGKNLPSREYVSTRYAKIESEPFDFLSAEAHVKSHYDHFILNADNPVYQNRHTEWVYGGSVKGEYRFSEGLLAQLSYAFDREEILSSKLGTRSRNRHAADLTCGYEFESLTLTGSLGTEKYDVYPGFETLRSASATYRISEEISLKAWLGRGIRYPNFTELYYSDPYTVGNAGLDPELCDDYGAGADFNTGTVNARVSAIFRNAFGLIDWGKESPSDTYWQAKNIGLVSTAGLNADVSAALGPVKVSAAYSVYDYIISRQYLPKYGASYLKNRLSASLDADVLGF
ncbi:MAG TPA: TonB-dependent receptor, partial [Candidatus Goldiibacteriota bacterium]|nr:TonB-dependent receptor [Candidatus Goldiibacteriota bacterium]